MKREVIITKQAAFVSAALIEEGLLTEYAVDYLDKSGGGIYKGRVLRYVPGMQAAFVDIGLEKNGFLPLNETDAKPQSGQEILVQVKKEAAGEKGAFLTKEIVLAGTYVLYLPYTNRIGVSSKIADEPRRRELKEIVTAFRKNEDDGFVIRTAAQDVDLSAVTMEMDKLKTEWLTIEKESRARNAPCLLNTGVDKVQKLLQDYSGKIDSVLSDEKTLSEKYGCAAYEGSLPLRMVYDIDKQLTDGQKRRVWLKSGGYLVIDPCEAMTVVDVNTGKYTGGHLLEDTVLTLNLEACSEIVRQVRLRNLSGIIIIDFIDMQREEARSRVRETLQALFASDRKHTEVYGFTKLGLLEITRKKDSLPLSLALKEMSAHA